MNIIEAIKSGKRFRRKGQDNWLFNDSDCFYSGFQKDFIAEDWEVEEKKVSLTEAEFQAAVNRTTKSFSMYNPPHISEYLSQLKKELGL